MWLFCFKDATVKKEIREPGGSLILVLGPYCHYTYIAVKHQQQGTLLYMCTINTQTQKQCLCSGNKIVISEIGIVDDNGCILMHYR